MRFALTFLTLLILLTELGLGRGLPEANAAGLDLGQLKNAAYQGIYDQPVRLSDGRYEGQPFVDGGASRPTVSLADTLVAYGDLDGEGTDEAALLLAENSGGSGTFIYLAVMVEHDGKPVNVATTLLGDRVQIRGLAIVDGQIIVDTLSPDDGDPAPSPTRKTRVAYVLKGDTLITSSTEDQGPVSLADLEGLTWMLRDPPPDTSAPSEPEITLKLDGDRIFGSSGCNNYQAAVIHDGNTSLEVGLVASTRKACATPIMERETVYLSRLQQTRGFGFVFGRLMLTYGSGTQDGSLFFEGVETTLAKGAAP